MKKLKKMIATILVITMFFESGPIYAAEIIADNMSQSDSVIDTVDEDSGESVVIEENESNQDSDQQVQEQNQQTQSDQDDVSDDTTSVSHYFSQDRAYQTQSTLNVGYGWMLNYQEKLESVTIGGVNKYKYTDGDGTIHYFEKVDNVWKDDSGLDLRLELNSSEWLVIDKKDNSKVFDTSGKLIKIRDNNYKTVNGVKQYYNQIVLSYSSGRLSSVTDAGGRTVRFNADASGRLNSITLPDGRQITYEYADGFLFRVYYPGNPKVNM